MNRIGLVVIWLLISACTAVCPRGWAVRSGMSHDAYTHALSPSVDVELSGEIGPGCIDTSSGAP